MENNQVDTDIQDDDYILNNPVLAQLYYKMLNDEYTSK